MSEKTNEEKDLAAKQPEVKSEKVEQKTTTETVKTKSKKNDFQPEFEKRINKKLKKYKNPKNFKRNLFAILFLGIVGTTGTGTVLSYQFSKQFDTKVTELCKNLSNDKYEFKYSATNSWLFFCKSAHISILPKQIETTTPLSQIKIEAVSSPVELFADIYIEDKEPLNKYLGKYGIGNLKLYAGFRDAELSFDVNSPIAITYKLTDDLSLSTKQYAGSIKFDYKEKEYDQYNLTLAAKNVDIDSKSKIIGVSLGDVTYTAPISYILQDKDDLTPPKSSHLKIKSVDFSQGIKMWSLNNFEYYRRLQSDGMEANGVKFYIGKNAQLGHVLLEGTNTPIKDYNIVPEQINANYNLQLQNLMFDKDNIFIQSLITQKFLVPTEDGKILKANLKLENGKFTSNGESITQLAPMFLNALPLKNGQNEGAKAPAPSISIGE